MTSVADSQRRTQDKAGRVLRRAPALLVAVLALFALAACEGGGGSGAEPIELRGQTMGTTWSLKVPAGSLSDAGRDELQRDVEATLRDFNQVFSTWRDDSTLSQFNAAPAKTEVEIGTDLLECLRTAFALRQDSRGAFDPTVGPIVNLWGFGPGGRPRAVPSEDELTAARGMTGASAMTLLDDEQDRPRLRKNAAGARLDLSAIAKGRGVDLLVALAGRRGQQSVFVNIGGEIRAQGEKAEGEPWRVAVERPTGGRQVAYQTMPLRDRAIATSGDYRNYFEEKGQRFSHTIDPRTGRPIRHALAQVSVIASDCESADGWATALNVLGPKEGLALAIEERLAALFLVRRDDGGFRELMTPAFEKLVPEKTAR